MKFIASLPEAQYYQLNDQTDKGFKLVDKASQFFAIISPVSKPFDQEWCVLLSPRFGKSDKTKYVTGLNLKLFPISPENITTPKGRIIREQYKALLAYSASIEPLAAFWSAPRTDMPNDWVSYSFI